MSIPHERAALVTTSLSIRLSRERDLEARLLAAEARLIRAAAALLRRAGETISVRRAVLQACAEVSPANDESPIYNIVPFWDDLSKTAKHRVGEILAEKRTRNVMGPERNGS